MRFDALKNLRMLVALGALLLSTSRAAEPAGTVPASMTESAPADSDSELGESGSANVLERYYSAQLDAAREEKKTLILAVFNSAGHSELSKVLLHTPEWKERVAGKYVIMPLDLRPALLENQEYAAMTRDLMEKFPVKSVPGMIFFDADRQPLAQIHGQTTKEGFLAALDKVEAGAAKRAELSAKRQTLKAEEAKIADQMIDASLALDTPAESLRDAIDDVLELDRDGAAGLKAKYEPIARILHAQALMQKNTSEAATMAEHALNELDATKLAPAWQERRMALLLDAILASGDTSKYEAALTAALALDAVQPEIKQAWTARTAGAYSSRGDTAHAEELVKKAVALAPQSAWAKSLGEVPAAAVATVGDSKLKTHDGKPFDLDAWKGKPVVIEFWSTANRHSPVALQVLADLAAQYKDKAGFIAINVGNSDDCGPLAAKMPSLTWVEDATGLLEDKFEIKRAPYTLLIGPDGKRVSGVVGLNSFNKTMLETRLTDLLK